MILREDLLKTKTELKSVRRSSNLARKKVEFARKVTEQRISSCLSLQTPEMEEEIVSLYSNLLDEDSFTLDGKEIIPGEDFLKVVEGKIGDIPTEIKKLNWSKTKFLKM